MSKVAHHAAGLSSPYRMKAMSTCGRFFLEKLTGALLANEKDPSFMEQENSLSCSQEFATG
jgi:hypothetical protein